MTQPQEFIQSPPKDKDYSSSEEMDRDEQTAFNQLIRPSDSYNAEGVYWADMPLGQRAKFVRDTDNAEVKNEMAWLWDMFKTDPLSPLGYYFKHAVIPGAGLGLEG